VGNEGVSGTNVSVNNSILRDKCLSNQDFGLSVRFIALPITWQFNKHGLESLDKDKRVAIEHVLYLMENTTKQNSCRIPKIQYDIKNQIMQKFEVAAQSDSLLFFQKN